MVDADLACGICERKTGDGDGGNSSGRSTSGGEVEVRTFGDVRGEEAERRRRDFRPSGTGSVTDEKIVGGSGRSAGTAICHR